MSPLRSRRVLPLLLGALLAAGTPRPAVAAAAPSPLRWHACATGPHDQKGAFLDRAGARCATVTVPVDWARPDGPALGLAISRIPATDPARRRGVLLVNPGGPGVSGLGVAAAIGQAVPALAARYDLIGFDPRFVGRSHALRCGWDTATFLRGAGPSAASFGATAAFERGLADRCAAHAGTDLLPYASTRNTARDLDAIRRALGVPRISYVGVSYGTYLGAVYLQLFGAHADRFVLDSAVSPTRYGPDLLRDNGPALRAALGHWAAWAARRDARYGLGRTRGAVTGLVERLRRRLDRAPLHVGAAGRLDAATYPLLLLTLLPDDTAASYGALARSLGAVRAAAGGRPVAATSAPALAALLRSLRAPAGDAPDAAGTPILCADRAAGRDPAAYLADIDAHRRADPLFAPLTRNLTPCAFWPVQPAEPPTTIATDHPALLVGAEGDPLTPLAGQRELHRALRGSRLLTLRGAYRHGVWLGAGSACVDGAVAAYLLRGRLPAADGRCPAVPGTP